MVDIRNTQAAKYETQFVEQKITQQVTIASAAVGNVTLTIPSQAKVLLKGYGYTWYTSNTYQLTAGTYNLPSRVDQEGSVSIPVIYGNPFPITSGNINLRIENNDSTEHTYDVVFYVLTNYIIPTNSTGGAMTLETSSASGTGNSVAIYNSTFTTAAGVSALGLAVNPSSPATLLCGSKTTTGAGSIVLAASTACKEVTLQADSANAVDVLVGNATSQLIRLAPLQSCTVKVANLNEIYIKRDGASNVTVNYIGA